MPAQGEDRRPALFGRPSDFAKLAIVTAAYYGSAKLGLSLAFESSSVTAIWPPTGLALAAILIWGYRMWPAIALGAFLANITTAETPLGVALGITGGNTLEAVAGAYLLYRVGFRQSLERMREYGVDYAQGFHIGHPEPVPERILTTPAEP